MKDILDTLIKQNKIVIDNSSNNISLLRKTYTLAEKESMDNSTWAGAIITKDNKIITKGANKFASKIKITKKRLQRPLKYSYINHAERDAIYLAAKKGTSLNKSTIYSPWIPCIECTNAIISSGIKKIILHYPICVKTPTNWKEELKESLKLLIESKIKIKIITEEITKCKNKFRGKIWYP